MEEREYRLTFGRMTSVRVCGGRNRCQPVFYWRAVGVADETSVRGVQEENGTYTLVAVLRPMLSRLTARYKVRMLCADNDIVAEASLFCLAVVGYNSGISPPSSGVNR